MRIPIFCGLLACGLMLAFPATAQTIDEIQVYDTAGTPASPYAGMGVSVSGVVTVTEGTYNSGTHYVQDPTGGLQFFKTLSGLMLGDNVTVTGTVGSFGGEIQISNPSVVLHSHGAEPEPLPAPISVIVADYEMVGTFVSTSGTVTAVASSSLFLAEGPDTVFVYIDADTRIDIAEVQVGDWYEIRAPVVVFNGLIELKPRRQGDLIEQPVIPAHPATWSGLKTLFLEAPNSRPGD